MSQLMFYFRRQILKLFFYNVAHGLVRTMIKVCAKCCETQRPEPSILPRERGGRLGGATRGGSLSSRLDRLRRNSSDEGERGRAFLGEGTACANAQGLERA